MGSWFWSSSPYANSTNGAWGVNFNNGDVNGLLKDISNQVRLVRAGQ